MLTNIFAIIGIMTIGAVSYELYRQLHHRITTGGWLLNEAEIQLRYAEQAHKEITTTKVELLNHFRTSYESLQDIVLAKIGSKNESR